MSASRWIGELFVAHGVSRVTKKKLGLRCFGLSRLISRIDTEATEKKAKRQLESRRRPRAWYCSRYLRNMCSARQCRSMASENFAKSRRSLNPSMLSWCLRSKLLVDARAKTNVAMPKPRFATIGGGLVQVFALNSSVEQFQLSTDIDPTCLFARSQNSDRRTHDADA